MKKFVVAIFAFSALSVFAAEVPVMDAALPVMSSYDTAADARFQMDKTTGEGSVIVSVTEMRWVNGGGYTDQWGHWYPAPRMQMPVEIFRGSTKVEGLALHGDQIIFAGRDGDVNCGRLGESSVLHRPTIFLSGNCKLNATISGNWNNAHVTVSMTTK
ncbi:MAG: hypothetical protein ACJ76H_12255 [Bacteriovoracaceae bacterium]